MDQKTYIINGKTYIQRKLVLGQIIPLVELLENMEIGNFNAMGLIKDIGPSLPMAAAIVLIPEGMTVRTDPSQLQALASEFTDHLEFETALEVVSDFLSFNPLPLLFGKIRGMISQGVKELQDGLSSMS